MMEDYIGDGVYVTFDGFAVTLDLRAQAPTLPITKIMLEPDILARLNEFYARAVKATEEAQDDERRQEAEGQTRDAAHDGRLDG